MRNLLRCLLPFFLLPVIAEATPLSGTYTINPGATASATNFQNILSAIRYLNGGTRTDGGPANVTPFGVSGPVVFNITPGNYPEAITIANITGTTATNTVTFQKLPASSGEVVLNPSGSSGINIFNLMNANTKYLLFKNLRFQPTITTSTSTVSTGIYYGSYITVDGCVFDMMNVNVGLGNIIGISTIDYVTVSNCTFTNSTDPNRYQGAAAAGCTNISFTNSSVRGSSFSVSGTFTMNNNSFEGCSVNLYPAGSTAGSFQDNTLLNATLTLSGAANTVPFYLQRNKLNITRRFYPNTTTGTSSDRLVAPINIPNAITASGTVRIVNNFISISPIVPDLDYGCIEVPNGASANTLFIYHNTVAISSSTSTIAAINAYSGTVVKNNIFWSNNGKKVATGNATFDYNNYYTTASPAYTVTDAHPRREKLFFTSTTDLHHTNACITGVPLTDVPTDIDNQPRSSTAPVMGATEAVAPATDGNLLRILAPVTQYVAGPSSQPVSFKLANNGAATITSITASFTVNNGTPISETISGLNISRCDSATVSFTAPYAFPNFNSNVVVYLTAVNGAADGFIRNDTAQASIDILGPMSGTYSINPGLPVSPTNYQRIGQADTALMLRSVGGPVTFQIYNGTYTQDTFLLKKIVGTSAINTIHFTSFAQDSNGVVITGRTVIDSSSYIRFSKLKFTTTNRIILVKGTSTNIQFNNNIIASGGNSTYVADTPGETMFGAAVDDRLTLLNNRFISGSHIAVSITKGTAAAPLATNVVVRGNIFDGGGRWNIITYTLVNRPVFENNTILNSNASHTGTGLIGCCTYYSYPITGDFQFYRCADTAFVINNKFINFSSNRLIDANYDEGTANTSTIPPGWQQLKHVMVANNFFSGANTPVYFSPYGIDSTRCTFAFNNIQSVAPITGYGIYVGGRVAGLYNNSIATVGAGKAAYFEAIPPSNYNNWYCRSNAQLMEVYGSPNNAFYSNLAAWQAGTGKDANSKSVNPKYVDSASGDLHVRQAVLLATGAPFNNILKDIDGEDRNQLNPCIGADEFQLPSADAGVLTYTGAVNNFPSAGTPVTVKLYNYGAATLTQVVINWSINGVLQTPYSWAGALPYDSTSPAINIGNGVFDMGKLSTLKLWTSLPNGAADMVNANDTLLVQNIIPYAHGDFTLGGTTPAFNSFTQAGTLLKAGGVDGPVNVLVRSGRYTDQPVIPFVRGTSLINPIIFRGESGDALLDTISFATTGTAANYVLRLDSAAFTTFKKMTFYGSGTSYSRQVELTNKCRFLTFDSCVFSSAATSGNYYHLEVGATANDSSFIITNNAFRNGGGGISLNLKSSLVKGNTFEKLNYASGSNLYAISATGATAINLLIDSNLVRTASVCSFFYLGTCYGYSTTYIGGIKVATSDNAAAGIVISRNQLYVNNSPGITFSATSAAATPARIYNNLVSSYGTNSRVLEMSGSNAEVFHNTFADSTGGSNYDMVAITGTGINLKNNVLSRSTPGNTVTNSYVGVLNVSTTALSTLTSNYNSFYGYDTSKIVYNGSAYIPLSQWQTMNGKDINSVRAIPAFRQATSDLHIDNRRPGAVDIYAKGTPVAYISKDIDDSLRSATTPSIGADEFGLFGNDAGVTAITSLNTPLAAGTTPVIVSLRNFGTNTLSTTTLNWSVDGAAQTPYNWSGNLTTGQAATGINIGSFNFTGINTLAVKVWAALPNGTADENAVNDTTTLLVKPSLCGTYTIGGATPDFATPKLAMAYLSTAGVGCPVVFNIRNGNYAEADTIPEVPGTSAVNTVTFRSESGDSTAVRFTQSDYVTGAQLVLSLTGADWLRFSRLSFERTPGAGAYYNNLVGLTNASTNNVFSNCAFITRGTGTHISTGTPYGATFVSYKDSANTFLNNRFTGGVSGLSISGGTALLNGVSIKNNVFQGFAGNTSASSDYYVINVGYAKNIEVSNNFIDTAVASRSTGIYVAYSTGKGLVSGNKILRRKGANGIYLNYVAGDATAANAFVVANNMVTIDSTNGSYPFAGIYASIGTNVKLLHNSVLNSSPSTASAALYYNLSGSSTIKDSIRNNIMAATGAGYAYLSTNSNSYYYSSHNDLYVSGSAILSKYNGTNYTTLAALQTASSMEGGSIAVNPGFVSVNDLHVTEPALKVGTPQALPAIPLDIDGVARSSTAPTMGAHELNVTATDAGLYTLVAPQKPFAAGTQNIQVMLRNYGLNTLSSATINWSINGVQQTPYSYSGSLAYNTISAPVTIGNYNFVINNGYTLKLWTSNPNGTADGNNGNDTLTLINQYPALNGVYTVGGTTPDFTTFNQTKNNLAYGGMLGNVTFNVRESRYNESLLLDTIPYQNNYTVTWQGETGDSTKAVLAYTGVQYDGVTAVLQFNRAKNLVFKNLTIQGKVLQPGSPSATFNRVIYFTTRNKNIRLVGNRIIDSSYYTDYGSANNAGLYLIDNGHIDGTGYNSASSADSAIVIQNNYLLQTNQFSGNAVSMAGQWQAGYDGTFTRLANLNNITISNNNFALRNAGKLALVLYVADSAVVSGNTIQRRVEVNGNDRLIVDKNNIYAEGYDKSTLTINSYTNRLAAKQAVVSNNFIRAKVVGLYNADYVANDALKVVGDRVAIYHNTLVCSDTGSSTGYNTHAALVISGQYDTVRNNVLYNSGGGRVIFQTGGTTGFYSNYNDFYYTAANFSYDAATLAQWRTVRNQDVNSLDRINPYLRGPQDLHGSNILLKTAPLLPAFATDIDGQPRSGTVCMGADEFTQPLNDLVLLETTPRKVFAEGINNLQIRVYNNGSNPVTSFTLASSLINYPDLVYYPGAGNPAGTISYTFSGNIPSQSEAMITIGQYNVPLYRNQLKVNISNLNGGADEVPYTDSLQNDQWYAGLNGTYTVKDNQTNATPTFKNFRELAAQLKFGGVYGPSTVNLLPGLHTSYLYIDSIPNRGALSPLVLQSADSDSSNTGIIGDYSKYNLFTLYRANHVTLRKLYFGPYDNTPLTTQNNLVLGFSSQDITVENCKIVNNNTATNNAQPAANGIFVSGNWSGQIFFTDSNYTFRNNLLVGGYRSLYVGSGGYNHTLKNVVISNNVMQNPYSYGISLDVIKNAVVDSNRISTASADTAFTAISLQSNIGSIRVRKNTLISLKDAQGIINDDLYGNDFAATDTLHISNNFITIGESKASRGIRLQTRQNRQIEVLYNSINNRSASANSVAYQFNTSAYGGSTKVLNNIFYNKSQGIPVMVYKQYSPAYEEHHNNLMTANPILANYQNVNYGNLSSLSATGIEYSSVTGDPLFVSDTNLHVDGVICNNVGTYNTPVTTDIDGETRSTSMPDIGADEFYLPDFGAVSLESPLSSCSHTAAESVKVWIKNFGHAGRANVPVAYRVNGGVVVYDTVRTMIVAGDSVLFTFAQTANLSAATDYNFRIWTNYRSDSLPTNDTLYQLVATTPANNTLPYYTGFEGSPNGWYTAGQNSSWKWGVVYSGVIDSAANGLNAWKTNLTGPHRNNEKSYLYSPCFDLSSLTANPTLNFNLAYQLQTAADKAWVEMSPDGGATWSKLGVQGDGMGWYNNSGNYWDGNFKYWHNARHELPISSLADKSSVRIRFVLQTDASIVQDGVAIDDISIYTGSNPPVSAGTYVGLVASSTGSGTFLPVNDPSGNRILEINDNGQNLGTITVDVNQNNSGTPTQYNGQFYLGRNWVIKVQNAPTAPVRVRLFITQAEFDAWKAADPTIDQVRSLSIYKFSGNVEDFSLANNTSGTPLTIQPALITKIPYLGGYFLEFSVTSFSEFWVTKAAASLPENTYCPGSTIVYRATSTGSTYQWQVNDGSGFNNLSNGGYYSGTTTATINLAAVPTSYTGYQYRCLVNGVADTAYTLRFLNTWTGTISDNWNTAANWSCGVVPDEYTDVQIPAVTTHNVVVNETTAVRSIKAQPGAVVRVANGVNIDIRGK